MWIPDLVSIVFYINIYLQAGTHNDLLATSGEYLRIWEVGPESKSVSLKAKLFNVNNFGYIIFYNRVSIQNTVPL